MQASKYDENWEFGLSAHAVIENVIFTLAGQVYNDDGVYFGIYGEAENFSFGDFDVISKLYSDLRESTPYSNIVFRNVVASLSTSTKDLEVMNRTIPSGFALQCNVNFEGLDFLPKNIFVFVNIGKNKIAFRGELQNWKLDQIDVEEAFLDL